ncbi:hypothetical protein FQN57_005274 [Myotisia sp. PD_48]|nr:hypothetical protein FQN57_005274 [Myotisia sp. PD_48]
MNPPRKRAWSVAELSYSGSHASPPESGQIGIHLSPESPSKKPNASTVPIGMASRVLPHINVSVTSRKSTACPSCRKQKVYSSILKHNHKPNYDANAYILQTKCVMEDDMPPCKRCADRGLDCSPNKSIQDLMTDQARWNSRMVQHFSQLQSALNETRIAVSLPPIAAPEGLDPEETNTIDPLTESSEESKTVTEITSPPDTLVSAPIRSLYEATKPNEIQASAESRLSGLVLEPDFISRGIISLSEADQLTITYLARLDPFFYDHLQQYSGFGEIRRTSTLLALTVCTVTALHDPLGTEPYERLSRELRTVASSLLFRNNLGLEDIKALCLGSYWLGDMTWALSGLVLRKAIGMKYHTSHLSQPQTAKEAFCRSQIWLLIYLSNEQISLLRGSPQCSVDGRYINWKNHLSSPFSGENDLRLISHIDLLLLLSNVRQSFGVDPAKPIPAHTIPQLKDYLEQLDRWGKSWTGRLARNKWLGNFPSQAVQLHWRFAKFFICSHAYRGLNIDSTTTALAPSLKDIANSAVTTAISILEMLIESDDLRSNLIRIPYYFHTMFAFAVVFILKAATRYKEHVQVDTELMFRTSRCVLEVFQHYSCARQHLVYKIARGLKVMIDQCGMQRLPNDMARSEINEQHVSSTGVTPRNTNHEIMSWVDLENFDFLSMSPLLGNADFEI